MTGFVISDAEPSGSAAAMLSVTTTFCKPGKNMSCFEAVLSPLD